MYLPYAAELTAKSRHIGCSGPCPMEIAQNLSSLAACMPHSGPKRSSSLKVSAKSRSAQRRSRC
eukprot:8174507-Alexandrium_andersonii.AAC.1